MTLYEQSIKRNTNIDNLLYENYNNYIDEKNVDKIVIFCILNK